MKICEYDSQLKTGHDYGKLRNFVSILANTSHLSGIPFFPIMLLSGISQPDYVHLNTCNNVQIMHPNAKIYKTRFFV